MSPCGVPAARVRVPRAVSKRPPRTGLPNRSALAGDDPGVARVSAERESPRRGAGTQCVSGRTESRRVPFFRAPVRALRGCDPSNSRTLSAFAHPLCHAIGGAGRQNWCVSSEGVRDRSAAARYADCASAVSARGVPAASAFADSADASAATSDSVASFEATSRTSSAFAHPHCHPIGGAGTQNWCVSSEGVRDRSAAARCADCASAGSLRGTCRARFCVPRACRSNDARGVTGTARVSLGRWRREWLTGAAGAVAS